MFRTEMRAYALRCGLAVAGLLGATVSSAQAKGVKIVHQFQNDQNASDPVNLVSVGGTLFGAADFGGLSGKGAIFSVNPATGAETDLYSFGGPPSDGLYPSGPPVVIGNVFYGTTSSGGVNQTECSNGCGTVFSVDLTTGAEKILHFFQGGTDGAAPLAGLITFNGELYGTTAGGGGGNCGGGCGTVFSIDPATGVEQIVYPFAGGHDGSDPQGLTTAGGMLYGVSAYGGTGSCKIQGVDLGCGTVYSLDPASGAERVLYSFQGGTDGAKPIDAFTAYNGVLYGTTEFGGSANCKGGGCGTLFSLDTGSGSERVVHAFQGKSDGSYYFTNLVTVGGTLYGGTQNGGGSRQGTVFAVNPDTGALNTIASFKGTPIAYPVFLTVAGRLLYGATSGNYGAIFSLKP